MLPNRSRVFVSALNAAILAALVAFAACGSSGNTYTSPSSLSKCSVTFDTPGAPVPASGGTGSITVKTERECQWTAQPDVGWLSITAGGSGQGDGTVQFNAGANSDPVARNGGIMLNGQRAQVTQSAAECRFELANSFASFPQVGGTGGVDVRASSSLCTWTSTSEVDWIAITSGANGKGSAPVSFTVASTTGPPRIGGMTIAGTRFTVTQSEGCSVAIAPVSYTAGASGGSGIVTVTAGAGCPWAATSNANWISITTVPSGTGNGTVGFAVAPTPGPSRNGTLTIGGQTFTVTQSSGCSVDVSPLTLNVDSSGGTRSVTVSTSAGCDWNATSNMPWITITSASAGTGPGTVTFSVQATTGPSRSGTLTVSGQTVTVVQGQGCTYAISPDNQSIPASGGNGTVTVTAGAGCPWTATSNDAWITVGSNASGSGNGSVAFSVAATTGPTRSGSLTIAGQKFTVNQGQGCTFSLSSNTGTAPAAGSSGQFEVRSAAGCGWSASSNASWLTITSGATGTSTGTVGFTAAANTGPQRSGVITVNGQTFTLTQDAGCSYTISPSNQNIGNGGGNVSVSVTAPAGCAWSASSNASWIGISSGATGSGPGTVQLVVAATSDAARNGTVTIANQTFTVIQAGCAFSIAPANATVPAGGGTGSFAVSASGSCAWTATSNAPWISITSGGTGTGAGTVQFSAAGNTGVARTGTITAAGQTFTIAQDTGCSYAIAPETIPVTAAGGSQTVNVATGAPACPWTAVSNATWIVTGSSASGSGNGSFQLDVQPNSGPPRTGTATVGGRTVTINQDSGCTYSIAPTAQGMVVAGGTGTVTVNASGGCTWTAVSNAPWITITAGLSGAGGGTVEFRVDANATGAARPGTLTIAGQTFTVNQDGSSTSTLMSRKSYASSTAGSTMPLNATIALLNMVDSPCASSCECRGESL